MNSLSISTSPRTRFTHFDAVYASRTTAEEPVVNDAPPRSPQKIDFTSRYSKFAAAATANELADYFRLTAVPELWNIDPLHWWYSRRKQFPNLYLLARNTLCIPGVWWLFIRTNIVKF
jgi:hypothetical protein